MSEASVQRKTKVEHGPCHTGYSMLANHRNRRTAIHNGQKSQILGMNGVTSHPQFAGYSNKNDQCRKHAKREVL